MLSLFPALTFACGTGVMFIDMSDPVRPAPRAPLSTLSRGDLVGLATSLRESRKAAKRFLHDRGIANDSTAIDKAIQFLEAHADWPAIRAEADRAAPGRAFVGTSFDPLAELRSLFQRRGLDSDAAVADLARLSGLDEGIVRATLEGGDVPASFLIRVLRAAGARRIDFGDD